MCVVIPVHQPDLTEGQALSLQACKAHLSAYRCYLVFPEGMNTDAYTSIFPQLQLQPVDASWLSSVERYNRMKVSPVFYQLFAGYEYMLTYELDAYIFSDDIAATGAFNFDYIGAPFFKGYWNAAPDAPLINGGNSGFSIRNIASCLKVLNSMHLFKRKWKMYQVLLASQRLRHWVNGITDYRYENYVNGYFGFAFSEKHVNEDLIWSRVVPQLFPWFKVADPLTAIKFSFEYNPERLLQLNGGQLPLGCHAWEKHPDFWKNYIPVKG